MPVDASAHGPALDHHLFLNLWIALSLLALAHLILLIGLLRPRRPAARPDQAMLLEFLPLLALAALFAWLTIRSERLWAATRYTGPNPAALQVEATGMQFAWYFRYPGRDARFGITKPQLADPGAGNPLGIDPEDAASGDDIVTSQLVIPLNREIDLRLQAQDVIHGFSVPSLRIKQNAIPGQTQHIHFTATVPGTYAILCTQLCGLGHYRMSANLRVIDEPTYKAWLQSLETPETP
jgi:cytochrome c oxidase subunit 2